MAQAAAQLNLVIPGLFGPPAIKQLPTAWQDLNLPAFEVLLSRAARGAVEARGLEQTLFDLFKIAIAGEGDVPVAAVTRQWDARDAGNHWWLRADPVHLRADRDRIVMLGNTALSIAKEEYEQLAAELNKHFADEAWDLTAVNARRWYLRLASDPGIRTEPLSAVVGQDILHHMPHGLNERHWRGLMNEVQMVLHASAVNAVREAQGQLPINSLWFWGGGRLPQAAQGSWAHVWGNDELTRSLAALTDVPCATLPTSAAEWLEDQISGDHLIVMDALQEKIAIGNVEGWREFLETLHDYWLLPLLNALKRRRLDALNLYPADGTVFRITGRGVRRWWVRRRPLAVWL
jgi:hypothetical protein